MTQAKQREVIKRAFLAMNPTAAQYGYWERSLVTFNDNTMRWIQANIKAIRSTKFREAARIELTKRNYA